MGKRSILKNSLVLISLTMLSRVLGLVREIVRASFLGTSGLSDAFAIGFQIPNLLRRLFAEGSIAVAFVPTFKGYLLEGESKKIKEFLNSLFTFLTFLLSVTVVAAIIITPEIISFFYSSLPEATHSETVLLTRFMFPFLAFVSVAALFQGVLNAKGIFGPSGFVPILLNVSIISSTLILSPYMENPARAMATGVLIGGALQALFQLPFVLRQGYRFGFVPLKIAFCDPGTRKVLRLVAPTVVGMAAYQINILASSVIAVGAGEGVVSSLQFSNRLLELLLGVFAVSLGTVILTELADNAKKKMWDSFCNHLSFALKLIALVTIPATFYAAIHTQEIITLLFRFKEFDARSVAITANAFFFHLLGLFFVAANRIISPAFYAMEDSKSPTFAGIISVIVNIGFAVALSGFMKGGGIALAGSIAALFNSILLLYFLAKKRETRLGPSIISTATYIIKLSFISLLISFGLSAIKGPIFQIFSKIPFKLGSTGLPLLVTFTLFSGALFLILLITKDQQITHITNSLKRRAGWKK